MKSLIFTDAHIHPHKRDYNRLQDCLNGIEWVFQTAKERNIEHILFLGDLFHDRQKIDVFTYQKTFELFQKNMDGHSFYAILGNHDMWHLEKHDISSVWPLSSIKNFHVIDRPCVKKIGGYEIGFLPYTHNPIEDIKQIKIKDKHKVLLGHVAVDGAQWNVIHGTIADVSIEHDGDMVKVGPEIFKDFDQVFLGHYHAEQKLSKNVEYVGSLLQLNFGEAGQKKHIVEYDLETRKKSYIENKFSPVHLILTENDDILSLDLEKNFIRIMSTNTSSSELIELKNSIKDKAGTLEIKQIPKKLEEEAKSVEDAKSILSAGEQMLETYIKHTDIKDLSQVKLLEIGTLCLQGE